MQMMFFSVCRSPTTVAAVTSARDQLKESFLKKKLRKSIKSHFTLQWTFSEDCKERSWLHYECNEKKVFEYAIDTHRIVGIKMSALVRLRVYFKRWTFFCYTFQWMNLRRRFDTFQSMIFETIRWENKKKIVVVVVARLIFIMLLAEAGSTRLTRPTSVIRSSCRRTVPFFSNFFCFEIWCCLPILDIHTNIININKQNWSLTFIIRAQHSFQAATNDNDSCGAATSVFGGIIVKPQRKTAD